MRVAIDTLLAEKNPGGMLFAARAMLDGLARIDHENEYVIVTGHPEDYQALATAPNIHIHAVRLASWRGSLIQHQLVLPRVLQQVRPDVLHVTAFAAPLAWRGPLVLTVHDLAFLTVARQPSPYAHLYWRVVLRDSVRRSQRVIAISTQTRDELISQWDCDPQRIRVIHNALRPSLREGTLNDERIRQVCQRYGGRYLLHVGRIVPRKNVERLVQAFNLLAPRYDDLQLVLIGGVGYGSQPVLDAIAASAYRDRMHLAGWVPDDEAGALYAGASVLVFPSLHEGFGLPVIEAMSCGVPIVASAAAASREVGGDAVIRADCDSPEPLAARIADVLDDAALRERLSRLGRAQAQAFTVEACAEATRTVYLEALNASGSSTSTAAEKMVRPVQTRTSWATVVAPNPRTNPRVSVIMPTTRPEQAGAALETLARQAYPGEVETIVVGPEADAIARQWKVVPVQWGRNPSTVRGLGLAPASGAVFYGDGHLASTCRNLGAARATGDVLLFLDDDCAVPADWAERNVRALEQPGIGAVGARIRGASSRFFARCTDYTNFGNHQHRRGGDGVLAGASLGVRREAFLAVGGYDEQQSTSEDTDLCYRLRRHGYRTVYHPDIVVLHDHRRDTFAKLMRYNYTRGQANGLTRKIQNQDQSRRNRLLAHARNPLVFALLLPGIALTATVRLVALNLRDEPRVIFYAPFILLGKTAYELGVLSHLRARQHPRAWLAAAESAAVGGEQP